MQTPITMSRVNLPILAAFAATYILWGGAFLAAAVALQSIPPFLLMGSRSLVGGALLIVYARCSVAAMPARLRMSAAACGIPLFVGCHGLMGVAQQHVPSGVAAIMMATIPFWIAILGFVLPTRRPSRPRTLALLIPGFAGVALVAWSRTGADRSGLLLFGIGLLITSAFFWALGSILLDRANSRQTSTFAMSGVALVSGGSALILSSAVAGEFARFSLAAVTVNAALGWTYLVLAGTITAFGSYVWLLERVSPTLVATYTFVNPVIAVLLGWAVLGESFPLSTLAGGGLVVLSIIGLLFLDATPGKASAPGTAPGESARQAA